MDSVQSNSDIPAELLAPPPRAVELRPERRITTIVKRVIFYFPGTMLGIGVVVFIVAELIFLHFAPVVPGRVTGLYWLGRTNKRNYYVKYSYDVGNQHFTNTQNIMPQHFRRLSIGMTVPVRTAVIAFHRYCEIDPPTRDYWIDRWLFWTLAVFWNPIMLALWAGDYFAPKWLVRNGEPVFGRVMAKERIREKSTRYRVRFEYATLTGETANRWMNVSRKVYESASEGNPIVVLYDPAHPKRSIVYDYCIYRAV